MKIGISFDLKRDEQRAPVAGPLPDDWQEEYDSPGTIEAIAAVLRELGHEVVKLGDGRELLERLLAAPPDLVFNFSEGYGVGRDREARVPAVLEMLGIPYTGSDPLTMAVTLDKDCAKRLAGVAAPAGCCLAPDADPASALAGLAQKFPLIVKPAWEGSSKGIRQRCLVATPAELIETVAVLQRDYEQPILIEEFIAGTELTVGILGNQPPQILGVMSVEPVKPTEQFVYSLEVKRDFRRQVRYACPAPLTARETDAVVDAALSVYRALGCRDVARIDFRLREGIPYFLEVNPLPGLNPESSDLVIMAGLAGWSYPRLIETIVRSAIERWTTAGREFPTGARLRTTMGLAAGR